MMNTVASLYAVYVSGHRHGAPVSMDSHAVYRDVVADVRAELMTRTISGSCCAT